MVVSFVCKCITYTGRKDGIIFRTHVRRINQPWCKEENPDYRPRVLGCSELPAPNDPGIYLIFLTVKYLTSVDWGELT